MPDPLAKYKDAALRASIHGGVGVQCCMCGKTGLSTIEGDGGTECQLEDGRWTCSEPCWEKAGGYGPDLAPAVTAPLPTRNEEAGFIEFLNYDAPTLVREIDGRCAILLDLNTRQTIGYRVYDPDLSPAEGQVRLSKELTDILAALPPSASGKPHLTFHATPSNPVISDEMVERGAIALAGYDWETCVNDRPRWRDEAREVLTSALSVKPQSGSDKP